MSTIIAVPGIMSDHRTWSPSLSKLAPRAHIHFADTTIDETLEAMAARAIASSEGDLFVLGHSMGGRVAMEIGRQAGGRVRAMVLSNTGHLPAAPGEAAKREERIATADKDMNAYAKAWVPTVISEATTAKQEIVDAITQMVLDCPSEVHARQNRSLLTRPDASSYLSSFDFPVLLMTGGDDKLSPETAHRAIADLIGKAESVVVPDTGHLTPFEQPEAVARLIGDWCQRMDIEL